MNRGALLHTAVTRLDATADQLALKFSAASDARACG
jgi:hypothetical protein